MTTRYKLNVWREICRFIQYALAIIAIEFIAFPKLLVVGKISEHLPVLIPLVSFFLIVIFGVLRAEITEKAGEIKFAKWIEIYKNLPYGSSKDFFDDDQRTVNLFRREIQASGLPHTILTASGLDLHVIKAIPELADTSDENEESDAIACKAEFISET